MRKKYGDIIRYKFDNVMAGGTISLVGMLFAVTTIVVIVAGIISFLTGPGTMAENIWASVMHVIDPGTITGDSTEDRSYLLLMSIVTLCGIFITSILISIITTGFKEKLSSLRKGNGKVVESGHTLILGYNENVHTIISELIKANANHKKNCIVILTNQDMEEVEAELSKRIASYGTSRIICRTGDISDSHMLMQCGIEDCKSVIVNSQDDFLVTKTMLAINHHLSSLPEGVMRAHVVTTVCKKTNFDAIKIAGGSYVEPILIDDTISRIIAQTCRQPGLSNVLIELFNYERSEIYFEKHSKLKGKTFGEAMLMFKNAIAIGVYRESKIQLNPDKNFVLKADDEIILLSEDDGVAELLSSAPKLNNLSEIASSDTLEKQAESILILGINNMLEQILLELDNYFIEGSKIMIADKSVCVKHLEASKNLRNIDLEILACDINDRTNLETLLEHDFDHVLLLSSDDCDTETSDSMTLLKLIHLRDIAQKRNKNFNITSEMKNTVNQKLAQIAKVNDLVVGSNIVNLISTQISENRQLASVFREILSTDGSEIYLRNTSAYIKTDSEVDFFQVTEIVKNHGEIALGYKQQVGDTYKIVLNPPKSKKITLTDSDHIIVLSSD